MLKFFILLPIAIIIIGFLFGMMKPARGFIALTVWVMISAGVGIYLASYGVLNSHPLPWLPALLLTFGMWLLAPWIMTIFSVTTETSKEMPVVKIVEAYNKLDDNHKQMIHSAVRQGAPIVARGLANYLDKKGWTSSAGVVRETSHRL